MKKTMIITAIVFILMYICYVFGYSVGKAGQVSSDTQVPFITEINDIRAAKGVGALTADPTLDQTAKIKAEDMAAKNYFEHNAPDGTPWSDFIYKNRAGSDGFAENIAQCYPTNHDTIIGWVNSPSHLENILNPQWTKYGTATVYDDDRHCFVTVNHFAR